MRLLLVMSILMNLDTMQIDYYTVDFVHVPIHCLVYVESPKDFVEEGN